MVLYYLKANMKLVFKCVCQVVAAVRTALSRAHMDTWFGRFPVPAKTTIPFKIRYDCKA